MKKLLIGILCALNITQNAYGNPPIVWGPSNSAQMLTPTISFTPNTTFIMSGTLTPTSSAVSAAKGSLYSSTDGVLYIKQDAGLTTNWTAVSGGGVTTIGAIDGQAAAANGAAISGTSIYMQSGDATHPGLINNTTQTISGAKTFSSTIVGSISGNAATVTTNANLTGPITSVGNATSVAAQTGTGSTFVMQNTPTLTTPVIGAATGTSLQLSGLTASQSVVTDSSKNLASLSYTANPTGSTIMSRDINGSTAVTNLIYSSTTTASAGQTITMNYGSSEVQRITGSSTIIFTLPDATTMYSAQTYQFNNNSTGTVTVNDKGGSLVVSIPGGGFAYVINTNNASSNGAWDFHNLLSNASTSGTTGTAVPGTFAAASTVSGTQLISTVSTGTAPLTVASTTQVANLNAATSGTATNATNVGITDDTSTNATMYPAWFTANTGNLPTKVSSTKLTFNPSTAALTTTTFVGALTGTASGNIANTLTTTTGDTIYASSANTPARLAKGTQYQVLQANATIPAYDAVHLDQAAAVTGVLPNANTTAVSTATASTIALRDASANLSANSMLDGYTTTATAAGTTTLVVGSTKQQYLTGTTTQTVTLPVTSTLALGQQFLITNNSTGLVTVQSSGANSIQVMAASSNLLVTCILTSGTTAASWNSYYYGVNLAVSNPPTIQKFTSSSGTYTTPANVAYISVRVVGGGGGGAGSGTAGTPGAGAAGGNSTFGSSLLTANGGSGGGAAGGTGIGGAGGAATVTTSSTVLQKIALTGGSGSGLAGPVTGAYLSPGSPGTNPMGGAGNYITTLAGGAGVTNTGAGGAGGSTNAVASVYSGTGGGAGGYLEAIITGPTSGSTYAYAVGAAGTAGTAGTSGFAGGAGGSGYIEVTEYYNNAVVQVSTVASIQPTIQKFTSSSGTYTTPTGVQYISVRMVGGGGGGAGGGSASGGTGGTGGNSTFGSSLLTSNGGVGGIFNSNGGDGGTATISAPGIGSTFTGGIGVGTESAPAGGNAEGGAGATSPFGGSGAGGVGNAVGNAGKVNSGSGGGGAGGTAALAPGGGGGAGGYLDAIITSPSATYSYAVGAAGSAGSAGTSGSAGGAGAAGYIEVTEYYNNLAVGSTSSVSANQVFAGPTSGANANPGFRALVAADLSAGPSSYYSHVYYPSSASNYWSQTGTTFGALVETGTTPTPTVVVNPNFGTISKATTNHAGINFSAPRTGVIKITVVATVLPGQNAAAAKWSLKLRETTTSEDLASTSGYQSLQSTVNGAYPVTFVGYFSATISTTYNFTLLSAISAGTLYIGAIAPTDSPASCLSFTMEYIK